MFIYVILWNLVMVNFPVHNFEITLVLHKYLNEIMKQKNELNL